MEERADMRRLEIGDRVRIAKKVDSDKYTEITTRGGGNCAIGFDEIKQEMLGMEGVVVDSSRNGELFLVRTRDTVWNWWAEDLALCSKWRKGTCR